MSCMNPPCLMSIDVEDNDGLAVLGPVDRRCSCAAPT